MMLPSATLTACVTRPIPPSADSLCLIVEPVPYTLVPRAERDAAAREGRPVRDDGNLADSDATRERLGVLNAKIRGVCQQSSNP